jgi:methenyltetrahydrofolate cyclohydrolase
MAFSRPLQDLTLGDWLDELATSAPTPGAGAALGHAVAVAASIVAMAARASESPGLAAQADALRGRALPLAELSAETYGAALAVRESTHTLKPEQRDWQIGQAFARAAEPPLEIARAAADVAGLAAELARSGDPRVGADVQAAAALAAGVARGALALVAVNLTALADDPRVGEARRLAESAADSARSAGC